MRQKRKSVKDKLKIVKKFLSGEDVIKDIFDGIEPITAFVIVDSVTGEEIERTGPGEAVTIRLSKTYEEFKWKETKTYEDPTIPGIHYQNPANVPELPENLDSTNSSINTETSGNASNEPTKGLSRQARLNAKLLEAQHIMEISKARRDRMNEFARINSQGWN